MRRYTKYKSSGLNWLGEVPSDWIVSSIRYNSLVIGRIGYRGYTVDDIVSEGEGAISLSPSNIQNQKFDLNKRTYISFEKYEESPEIKVYEGDVLLVKTASVGKVAFVDNLQGEKATINPQLVVFKNILINSRFFYYYLISNDFQYQIDRDNYGGVVGTLTQASINSYRILVPSDKEQIQIARFLDHQTGVIDDLIKQKEKLIELLKEKRQAVINEAVTKGLDPNAKMKDSGIEWLGEIPKNWTPAKIKFVAIIKGRIGYKGYTKDDIVSEGEGALTLGAKHIDKNNNLNLSDPEYISWEKYNESPEIMVKLNDVIFTQRGSLGKICHINVEIPPATINPSMVILTATKIRPRYLYYWLTADRIQNEVELLQSSTAVPMISQFQLSNFPMIIPPIDEQAKIVKFIDNSIASFNKVINDNIKLIESLREYRQSIISEAVTGKIDVRDWQPKKQALS